jgi:hypothetical protein
MLKFKKAVMYFDPRHGLGAGTFPPLTFGLLKGDEKDHHKSW